uniref:Nitronate monooxygenase domain-containing protein n=1 Tax=Bionectria ochroleuca TaxID=29856 RepID=A0A8H7N5P4_BIOOC
MYGHSNATLAVEVTKAAGLGFIPGGFDFRAESPQIKALEDELMLARSLLEKAGMVQDPLPVGVGFITCHPSASNFAHTALPVLLKYKPTAVWLFAPDPDAPQRAHPEIIRHLHASGIKEAVSDGADVLVAQGMDAGGHQFARGASVISLVPEIRHMLDTEFPQGETGLLAAGGIVGARAVAASLALGADGAVLGTRLLVAPESSMSKIGKESIIKASDGGASTVKSTVLDDIQSTAIWPKLYDGRALIGESYKDHEAGMPVKDNVEKFKEAAQGGDESRKIIWCGTGIGLVNEALPAGVIIAETRKGAESVLKSLS